METLGDLRRFVSQSLQELLSAVNGRLEFQKNVQASGPFTVTFSSANTDVKVPHLLGKLPEGFLVIQTSAAMSVYVGAGTWTVEAIYLKSNATGTAQVYVI